MVTSRDKAHCDDGGVRHLGVGVVGQLAERVENGKDRVGHKQETQRDWHGPGRLGLGLG